MHIKFAIEIFTNLSIREIRENYWSRTFCDIRYVQGAYTGRAPGAYWDGLASQTNSLSANVPI